MRNLGNLKKNRLNVLFFGVGLLTLGLGLGFIWLGGQVSRLACTRLETNLVECQLQRQFLGLITTDEQHLSKVIASEVREDCLDGCRYWIELLTEAGPISLTRFSSYNRRGVQADQQAIQAFLADPQAASFEFRGSLSWGLLLSSLPLLGVGGFLAISYGQSLFEA